MEEISLSSSGAKYTLWYQANPRATWLALPLKCAARYHTLGPRYFSTPLAYRVRDRQFEWVYRWYAIKSAIYINLRKWVQPD